MHCFSLSVPEISAPPASISLKVLLSRKETERGAANTTARCAAVINSLRALGISVIGYPQRGLERGARDITGSLARICTWRVLIALPPSRVLFFSSFPSSHRSGGIAALPATPAAQPPSHPRTSHAVRAGALIMRGFRRSRFHSFLRLRHREMIIGT